MRKLLILLFIFFSCSNFAFASTTAEFQNCKQKDVVEKIAKYYVKQGIRIDSVNDFSLTATKVYTGAAAAFVSSFIYGSNINSYPELKYNFNIIQNNNNVLVSLNLVQLNNAGTALQSPIYLGQKEELKVLSELKSLIEGYYSYGFTYIPQKKYLKIASVEPNFDASQSGLAKDCLIVAVNEKKVDGTPKNQIMQELVPRSQDSIVKIKYMNNEKSEPLEITIKSKFVKPFELL